MNYRIILIAIWSFLLISVISCVKQPSESDRQHQQQSLSSSPNAVMDTSEMETFDGVPIMPAPGSQIEKDKVEAMLQKGNLSFRNIASPRATVKETEKSTEKLIKLFDSDRVRKDKELKFMVHTMLGNSYLQLYEQSEQNNHLRKAKDHFDSAISLFKNQPEYKADLAEPYSGRVGIFITEKKYNKAISEMKYLIEEYQKIGFGPYNNWFASHQVEWLHSLARKDTLKSKNKKSGNIINYLIIIGEKYDNEVGITAQIVLARHYLKNEKPNRVKTLSESIENRLATIDNPAFKKDKWKQFKVYKKQIKKRKRRQNEQ